MSTARLTVGDLFDTVIGRLSDAEPVEDIYSAIGIVTDYLASRLFQMGSKALQREVALTFLAGVNTATLPDGLLGTLEPPILIQDSAQYTTNLTPLQFGERAYFVSHTQQRPIRYEIIDSTMTLYPSPDRDYTVAFEASISPTKPTLSTDVLPFNGIYDYIFREVVLLVVTRGGGAVVEVDTYLQRTFDTVEKNRSPRRVGWRYSL